MGNPVLRLVTVAALTIAACTSASTTQAPTPQQPTITVEAAPPAPGSAGPRRAPNPIAQDSSRRAQVDSIMRTIAGREHEPAGTVFKNVKLLKQMPAGEFLKNMDVNYGRGLGMSCGNCHVLAKYDDDTRKNKRVAREMQEMTDYINTVRLTSIKELDEDHVSVTCVTCHGGSQSPRVTMPVPKPASTNR
jgi:photosynthetic reaction center cytochrome c subunit